MAASRPWPWQGSNGHPLCRQSWTLSSAEGFAGGAAAGPWVHGLQLSHFTEEETEAWRAGSNCPNLGVTQQSQ